MTIIPFSSLGLLAAALIAGDLAAQRQRRGFDGNLSKARSFLLQRDYGGAEEQARAALKLDPGRWEGLEVLAEALRFKGDYAQASETYAEALTRAPEDQRARLEHNKRRCSADGVIETRLEEAQAQSNAGHVRMAASLLSDASDRAPARADIALSTAKTLLAAGGKRRALSYLQRASAALGDTEPFRLVLAEIATDSASLLEELLVELKDSVGSGLQRADLELLVRLGLLVAPKDFRFHLWAARCARLGNDDAAFAAAVGRALEAGWKPSPSDETDALLGVDLKAAVAAHSAPAVAAPSPESGRSEGVRLVGDIEVRQVRAGVLPYGPHDGRDGHPVVTVTRSFSLGTSEVTRAQWQRVMGWLPRGITEGSDLPIAKVTWEEAWWFCRRLSALTGESCRLPTQVEWKLAADEFHQALTTVEQVEAHAWLGKEGLAAPQPVRGKLPRPPGFYDLHGNVAEMVADWQGDLSGIAKTDPTGPDYGSFKIALGGDWRAAPFGAMNTAMPPRQRRDGVGFRIAVDEAGSNRGADPRPAVSIPPWQPGRSAIDLASEEDPKRKRIRRTIRISPQSTATVRSTGPVLMLYVEEGDVVVAWDGMPPLADGGSSRAMIAARSFRQGDFKIERVENTARWVCRDREFMQLLGENDYELVVEVVVEGGAKVAFSYDLLGYSALREELERPWAVTGKAVRAGMSCLDLRTSASFGFDYPIQGEAYRDDASRNAGAEKKLTEMLQCMAKPLAGDSTWRLELRVQGSTGPKKMQSQAFRGPEILAILRKAIAKSGLPETRVEMVLAPDRAPIRRTDISYDQADHVVVTFFVDGG